MRTESNLRQKLEHKHYDDQTITSVIEKVKEYGYLNDEQFMDSYIQSILRLNDYGYLMVKKKLLERGITRQMIEENLDRLYNSQLELEIAQRMLAKQNGDQSQQQIKSEKQKLARRLQARGFRMAVISKLLF